VKAFTEQEEAFTRPVRSISYPFDKMDTKHKKRKKKKINWKTTKKSYNLPAKT
jgi:hypothetical protein